MLCEFFVHFLRKFNEWYLRNYNLNCALLAFFLLSVCAKYLTTGYETYAMNTDISTDLGEHCVAVYFRRNQAIFFDSYERTPEEDYVLPFLERNSASWINNT